jgi:hypothetical protein
VRHTAQTGTALRRQPIGGSEFFWFCTFILFNPILPQARASLIAPGQSVTVPAHGCKINPLSAEDEAFHDGNMERRESCLLRCKCNCSLMR